jgi:hypothetical protein
MRVVSSRQEVVQRELLLVPHSLRKFQQVREGEEDGGCAAAGAFAADELGVARFSWGGDVQEIRRFCVMLRRSCDKSTGSEPKFGSDCCWSGTSDKLLKFKQSRYPPSSSWPAYKAVQKLNCRLRRFHDPEKAVEWYFVYGGWGHDHRS